MNSFTHHRPHQPEVTSHTFTGLPKGKLSASRQLIKLTLRTNSQESVPSTHHVCTNGQASYQHTIKESLLKFKKRFYPRPKHTLYTKMELDEHGVSHRKNISKTLGQIKEGLPEGRKAARKRCWGRLLHCTRWMRALN